jgi:hypothetical protein
MSVDPVRIVRIDPVQAKKMVPFSIVNTLDTHRYAERNTIWPLCPKRGTGPFPLTCGPSVGSRYRRQRNLFGPDPGAEPGRKSLGFKHYRAKLGHHNVFP